MSTQAPGGGGGGAGFMVEPSTLEATANALAGLGEELASLSSKAPPISAAALGGGNVAATVDDFYHAWGYAVGQLNKSVNNAISNLHQAAVNYETSDTCVAQGAHWK